MEMTVAIVNVSGVVATANRIKLITRGIVGANVQIVYDSTVWIGLRKTVVFEGSGVTRDVLDAGEIVEIPPEVASEANSRIRMGIYGVSDDGSVVVPTIWAELGRVRDSADPSGDESTAPELPVWAQLDSRVKKLESQAPSDGDSSAFYIAISEENGSYVMDKTFPELKEAHEAGRPVYAIVNVTVENLRVNNAIFQFSNVFDAFFVFTHLENSILFTAFVNKDGISFRVKRYAEESSIPNKLPNPNVLTFTGAVSGTYDGSDPVTIDIPNASGGKSAYEYAQDAGYTGSESDFAKKLAEEPLRGFTSEITPQQVYDAVIAGRNVVLIYAADDVDGVIFTGFVPIVSAGIVTSSGIISEGDMAAYLNLIGIVDSGEWHFSYNMLPSADSIPEIPDALPNPNALTFTGAVSGSYDGSAPVTLNIPDSGGTVGFLDPEDGEVFTSITSGTVVPDNPEITLTRISATYTGGNVAVGTAVSTLKGITVTAHYSDGSTASVTGYTLSGTIREGSNTITVSYGGKTTTFTVTGEAEETGDSGLTDEELAALEAMPDAYLSDDGEYLYWNPLMVHNDSYTPKFQILASGIGEKYVLCDLKIVKLGFFDVTGSNVFNEMIPYGGTEVYAPATLLTTEALPDMCYVHVYSDPSKIENFRFRVGREDYNTYLNNGNFQQLLYDKFRRLPIKINTNMRVLDVDESIGANFSGLSGAVSNNNGYYTGLINYPLGGNLGGVLACRHVICSVGGYQYTGTNVTADYEWYNPGNGTAGLYFCIPTDKIAEPTYENIKNYILNRGIKFFYTV